MSEEEKQGKQEQVQGTEVIKGFSLGQAETTKFNPRGDNNGNDDEE